MAASSQEPASLPHRPRMVRILEAVDEIPNVKSLNFKDRLSAAAKPGQFGMVWAPGVDEIPMSLLPSHNDDIVTITVRDRGEASRALHRKKTGDLIGIRGPYGKGFTYTREKTVLMIGGGTGVIPLMALVRTLASRGVECNFVLGAHNSRELLFSDEIRRLSTQTGGVFAITTDDGSLGLKGLATDEASRLLNSRRHDHVYACGPETMMRKAASLAEEARVPMEAGLERIFKCGSGICGSCCIGPYLVCKDGPVFKREILRELPEFGKSTRDASGRPVAIRTP